ncbi:MAG: hypothetical protein AMJ65_05550 [Phycisphaerae bacterium SG8_4]|nr:MAG: hypothetical protein AMJ65_05550 [Phycisphaerae bacterium SG8_4]
MAENTNKSFNPRAFASVLAGLSFALMVVTGLALFIAPSCRIASDTSWTVWGHNKDQWVAVHVWLSIAFITASAIHIYLNWSVLTSYFKSKIRKGWAFRAEWLAALAVCAVLYAGSARELAPFSSLMAWKETFKHPAAGASGPGAGSRRGRAAGQQVRNLAVQAESAPAGEQQGHIEQPQTSGHGPGRAGGGMGQKTLSRFCSDEGIDLSWAISHLKSQGLTVRDTMTMRQIADALGVHPRELPAVLQPRQ